MRDRVYVSKSQSSRQARRIRQQQRNRLKLIVAAAFLLMIVVALIVALATRGGKDNVVPGSPGNTPAVQQSVQPEASPSAPVATQELTPEPSPTPTLAPLITPEPANTAGTQQIASANGLRSARIRMIGDIMVSTAQLEAAKQFDGSYDFLPEIAYVADSLRDSDLTIGNLETTIGKYKDMKYSGYPMFNTPESLLDALKECGVDFLTLANNHMLDRYFDGMKNTVNVVESYGFGFVGAYRTRQERETGACIQEVNGIKLGFVAYTHSTNTMETACSPDVKEYGVPYIQKADFKGDIQRLKDAGADVIIALPHWGDEYIQQPDGNQIYYAGKLASAGADIILGSHSHMVQPMEYKVFTDANGVGREVFAIFSMGNFISDMTKKYTDSGIILDFTIQEQADGTFRVENVGYVPLYMWKQDGQYSVVSSAQYLNSRPTGMDDANYNRMVETYSELQQVLGTNWRVLEK